MDSSALIFFRLPRQENCFGFSTHLGIFAAVAFHTTTLSFPLHMFCEPLFFEQCLLKKFFSFSFVMLFRLPIFVPFVPCFSDASNRILFLLETARENFQHNGMSKQPLLKPTYEQMKLITGFLQIVGTSAQAFLIAEELVLCVSVCVFCVLISDKSTCLQKDRFSQHFATPPPTTKTSTIRQSNSSSLSDDHTIYRSTYTPSPP